MTDTFSKFDQARALLRHAPEDQAALALVREAYGALAREGSLSSLAVRNQVLRLGSAALFRDYLALVGDIDWQHLGKLLQDAAFDNVFKPGNLAYLDLLLGAGAPPRAIFDETTARAFRATSAPLVDWLCTRASRHISPLYATCLLLDLAMCCDRPRAEVLAPVLRRQVPQLGPEVRYIFFDLVAYKSLKAPAILLLCGLDPAHFQAGLRECSDRVVGTSPRFVDLARLGASKHGQLQAMQREPDLPDVICRSEKESFLGLRE